MQKENTLNPLPKNEELDFELSENFFLIALTTYDLDNPDKEYGRVSRQFLLKISEMINAKWLGRWTISGHHNLQVSENNGFLRNWAFQPHKSFVVFYITTEQIKVKKQLCAIESAWNFYKKEGNIIMIGEGKLIDLTFKMVYWSPERERKRGRESREIDGERLVFK